MLEVIFTVINVLFALLLLFLTVAFLTGAPFVPSTAKTASVMIDFASLKPGMVVYDLGSGDGRLLFSAAEFGAKAIGFEINPFLVFLTALKKLFFPMRHLVTVRWKNFWTADFRDADVIFVYLLPWRMDKLADKIKNSVKPGAIVISNSFIFPGWKIIRKNVQTHVFAFHVPKVDESQ